MRSQIYMYICEIKDLNKYLVFERFKINLKQVTHRSFKMLNLCASTKFWQLHFLQQYEKNRKKQTSGKYSNGPNRLFYVF